MKVDIITLTCKRCGHKWVPRIPDPRICPGCKHYKWDIEKDEKPKGVTDE